jgi:hypothetical protein
MTRNILIVILVYFIYRVIKYLIKLFLDTKKSETGFPNQNSAKPNKSSVDKKDIIDAEFEEIDESEKKE